MNYNESRKTADDLIRRIMNNKKKLYILIIVIAAIVAAAIILFASLFSGADNKSGSIHENTPSEIPTESAADASENIVTGDNTDADAADAEEKGNSDGVQIEIPVEELGKLVDAADEAYKSFEVLPVDSADFFLGKKLRLVATLQDDDSQKHTMKFMYDQNITATVTDAVLAMKYKNGEGIDQTHANYVYAVSDEPFTSPGGRNFAIVAFGDHEITEENKEFLTDCFVLIKMRDDVDMSIAPADTYVLLIESAMPEVYELFKVEE